MKKILFSLCILLTMPGCAQDSSGNPSEEVTRKNWQEKISILDQGITRKKNLSDLYRAKAIRAKNQGDRLQFNPDNVSDARRYWNVADYYNEQADLLDKQVIVLENERQRILEKYA